MEYEYENNEAVNIISTYTECQPYAATHPNITRRMFIDLLGLFIY